jgi:shikimate dehydrogenase
MVYVAHDVQPGQVRAALAGARAMGYRGLSVTIPHKVEAMQCVDEVDETAQVIGCINTVVRDGERLLGYNSDGLGALGALRAAGADPEGSHTLVLGSGGAARAITVTLSRTAPPQRLAILGVQQDELDRLVTDVRQRGKSEVYGAMLTEDSLADELARAEMLLHCSPIGMHPHQDACLVPQRLLREGLVVFDAVYNPRRTQLLQWAQQRGCRTVEGLEMFLGQALVQFELWTGRKPPHDVMRKVLEENLRAAT